MKTSQMTIMRNGLGWMRSCMARISALFLLASAAAAQADLVYAWANFVGQPGGGGNVDGTGGAARFGSPTGVAVDGAGNLYVADSENCTIRKVTPAGVVTTLAGSAGLSGSADGTGDTARFSYLRGVAVDGVGNVFVADVGNHTIRKVTPEGVVTTVAGSPGNWGSADGTGSAAQFWYPSGVAVDGAGNVFVADTSNHTIRKVTAAGVVTTLAGSAGLSGSADGTGDGATFYGPYGVAVDGAGNVFVADTGNHTIRKVTAAGVVTTLAGSAGVYGSTDGTGSAALFYRPTGVAVDGAGNAYVADTGSQTIRKITPTGVVSTLAGSALNWGNADGLGGVARFNQPTGVAVNGTGNVFVADTGNSTIRKMTAAGTVTTLAGCLVNGGTTDGTGGAALFAGPSGVAVDGAGNVYVADAGNCTIRKVTAAGVVTTLAGSAGNWGSADGTGGEARFYYPQGVAVDGMGNVFVGDTYNHTIRMVTPAGVVTTLAGNPNVFGFGGRPAGGYADGTGGAARFNQPTGVAVDGAGNVFVADTGNQTIRKITPSGVVTTLAGNPNVLDQGGQPVGGYADGTGGAARFSSPRGVAMDGAGNVYVADTANQTIRKVTVAGVVTTLAGKAGFAGWADGAGGEARFYGPQGVAVDGAGNVFVADTGNNTIWKVTATGVVTTIGGLSGVVGGADGIGSSANFSAPFGIAIDGAGRLYMADSRNNSISKGTSANATPTASTITYGQTLAASTLTGGAASVPGTFAFTTPAAIPNAGTTGQSVTFTPTDAIDYNTLVFTVSVTVNKVTPAVTVVPTASSIAYGQTLGASVLTGGAASVPGTFVFTTPAVIPDNLGKSNQSVTFTPTDAGDYNTVIFNVGVRVVAPLPFSTWVAVNGIPGTQETAFLAWNAEHGLPNGLAYAFQSNLVPGEPCLVVRCLNGVPVVEAPLQNASTLPFVDIILEGTTDLTAGTWTLVLVPAADQTGVTSNRCRWVPVNTPRQAFFRLRASLR